MLASHGVVVVPDGTGVMTSHDECQLMNIWFMLLYMALCLFLHVTKKLS